MFRVTQRYRLSSRFALVFCAAVLVLTTFAAGWDSSPHHTSKESKGSKVVDSPALERCLRKAHLRLVSPVENAPPGTIGIVLESGGAIQPGNLSALVHAAPSVKAALPEARSAEEGTITTLHRNVVVIWGSSPFSDLQTIIRKCSGDSIPEHTATRSRVNSCLRDTASRLEHEAATHPATGGARGKDSMSIVRPEKSLTRAEFVNQPILGVAPSVASFERSFTPPRLYEVAVWAFDSRAKAKQAESELASRPSLSGRVGNVVVDYITAGRPEFPRLFEEVIYTCMLGAKTAPIRASGS